MAGKAIDAIMFSMVVMSLPPSTALSYSASGVELVGERTAAFLASPFAAAFDPAPLAYPPPRMRMHTRRRRACAAGSALCWTTTAGLFSIKTASP